MVRMVRRIRWLAVLVLAVIACSSTRLPVLVFNPRLARVESSRLAKVVRDLPHMASKAELSILLGAPEWCDEEGCTWSRVVEHFEGVVPAAPDQAQVRVSRGDSFVVECRPECAISVVAGPRWLSREWPR